MIQLGVGVVEVACLWWINTVSLPVGKVLHHWGWSGWLRVVGVVSDFDWWSG